MNITRRMLEILKLRLQGHSPYRIARILHVDPPTVYDSLRAAEHNFQEAERMIIELKALGWPEKFEHTDTTSTPARRRSS